MATAEVRPALPDELLEDIFLRLDDAADLARASASCTSFRRVVSSRRFLRRFRSLHTPPVLGFLEFIGVAGLHFHHAGLFPIIAKSPDDMAVSCWSQKNAFFS